MQMTQLSAEEVALRTFINSLISSSSSQQSSQEGKQNSSQEAHEGRQINNFILITASSFS